MASSIWGGVPGPPEYGSGRPRTMYNIKQTIVEVFACLDSSHGFLSTIFGILGKFWIDIGKNIFRKYIFFKTKKKSWNKMKIFSVFFSDKKWKFWEIEILEISKFWKIFKFWNFDFSKFSFFVRKKSENMFQFFPRFFFGLEKNIFSKNIFTYINSKFPQDSKNRT